MPSPFDESVGGLSCAAAGTARAIRRARVASGVFKGVPPVRGSTVAGQF
jgi:hypothetical protein